MVSRDDYVNKLATLSGPVSDAWAWEKTRITPSRSPCWLHIKAFGTSRIGTREPAHSPWAKQCDSNLEEKLGDKRTLSLNNVIFFSKKWSLKKAVER